jgi:hypothetical protein
LEREGSPSIGDRIQVGSLSIGVSESVSREIILKLKKVGKGGNTSDRDIFSECLFATPFPQLDNSD